MRDLFADQINELLVALNSGAANEDPVWSDVLQLELLEGEGGEVVDVALEALHGEAEALQAVGGLKDDIREFLALVDQGVDFVGVFVLIGADLGGNDGSGLQGAVC